MSEPVNFVVEHYDNQTLVEANELLASGYIKKVVEIAELQGRCDELYGLCQEVLASYRDIGGEHADHYAECLRKLGGEPSVNLCES